MIVPMKKITLLCLEQDKTAVLEKLRDLGVMQLRYAKTPESADVTALTGELNSTERAAMLLITEEGKYNGPDSALKGKEAVARVLALTEERNQLAKTGNELERELEALQPWGDFDPAAMDAVRENGLYPYLCAVRKQDSAAFRESLPERLQKPRAFPSSVDRNSSARCAAESFPERAATSLESGVLA